jgi:hypothetical protein
VLYCTIIHHCAVLYYHSLLCCSSDVYRAILVCINTWLQSQPLLTAFMTKSISVYSSFYSSLLIVTYLFTTLLQPPQVYLSTKTLTLDPVNRTSEDRPLATGWVSGVGTENVNFEPPVPLDGKVEIYHQTLLTAFKQTLFNFLTRSVVRYASMNRNEWLQHKINDTDPNANSSDPAQIILLTLAIFYVQEVEQVFVDFSENKPR